jgi:hypothetical protein
VSERSADQIAIAPPAPARRPSRLVGLMAAPALALVVAGCGQSAEKTALKDYLTTITPLVERDAAISERLRRVGLAIPMRQDARVVADLGAVAASFRTLAGDLRKAQPTDADLTPVHRELAVAVELRRRAALLLARAVREHLQEPANRAGELAQNARVHEVAFQRRLVAVGRRRSVEIRFGSGSGGAPE